MILAVTKRGQLTHTGNCSWCATCEKTQNYDFAKRKQTKTKSHHLKQAVE